MTYCAERTNLLAAAGREIAERLLPEPFSLWYSAHDTGRQMTIVAPHNLIVWRGSVWHHGCYEFNDRDHIPGLQPDFAFAAPVIDRYFADVREAVTRAAVARWADRSARILAAQASRLSAIEAVRATLALGEAASACERVATSPLPTGEVK